MQLPRKLVATVVAGILTWGVLGSGIAAHAASATVITAGNLQISFGGAVDKGAVGDVGGYASLGFDFETGQAGMFGDVQIGQDANGNPTLTGDLAELPPSDTLASAPSSATLTVTAGESLLVFDSAGNYVLAQITNATPRAVYFTYTIQTAMTTVPPPAAQDQGAPSTQGPGTTGGQSQGTQTTQGQTQQQSTPSAATTATATSGQSQGTQFSPSPNQTQGAYPIAGNCITVADNGNAALQVGIELTALGAAQGQTVAQAQPNMALVLNVAIAAPTDVSNVAVNQSGEIGGNPWYTPLYGDPQGENSPGIWTFSMQQTDPSQVYHIMITSPTLASDGIANPSTGLTELDWTFNTSSGCGGQGSQSSSQPQTQAQSQSSSSKSGSSPVSIALQIGSQTATVNGQPESLIAPAEIDSANRTMVPFRFLGQALGATVSWDGTRHTASYQLGSTDVAVTIGGTTATVDGRSVTLDAPPVIVDGSTMVPVRFISEALGAQVGWDSSTQTVTITYGAP